MALLLGFGAYAEAAHWSDAQVRAAIDNSHMTVLVRELQTAQCPAGIPHAAAASWREQRTDPYEAWLNLVAAHLHTGAPLDAAYAAAAQRAYDEVYNIWFDCIKHIHDVDELQLRADETPARVGAELLAKFAPTDENTRARAAAYLIEHYH